MSADLGIEFVLTRENGKFILRSGSPTTSPLYPGVRPIMHTHPPDYPSGFIDKLPSQHDIDAMNDLFDIMRELDQHAKPPRSKVFWGQEDFTPFGPTNR